MNIAWMTCNTLYTLVSACVGADVAETVGVGDVGRPHMASTNKFLFRPGQPSPSVRFWAGILQLFFMMHRLYMTPYAEGVVQA